MNVEAVATPALPPQAPTGVAHFAPSGFLLWTLPCVCLCFCGSEKQAPNSGPSTDLPPWGGKADWHCDAVKKTASFSKLSCGVHRERRTNAQETPLSVTESLPTFCTQTLEVCVDSGGARGCHVKNLTVKVTLRMCGVTFPGKGRAQSAGLLSVR